MTQLGGWMLEIENLVAALGAEPALGIEQAADPALSRAMAQTGFSGVLPLWSGRHHVVGLLADPRTVPQTWPAVILQDGQGLTIASDARTLLPQLIALRVLSKFPANARRLVERWPEIGPNAIALQRTLGGTDEALEAVVATVSDPAAREAFNYRKGQGPAFEAAHSALCRKIDRSETFVRYADWLDGCLASNLTAPEDPVRYGSWGRRVLCWSQRLAFTQPSMPKLSSMWLYRIVEEHAGIDSGVPVDVSWSVEAGGASGETALTEAAMVIDREQLAADPVSAGIMQALVTEGITYDGLAHAEAVVVLDERGEPERAWTVLQSATWWAARNTGQVPEALLEGARFLSGRHDWADVRWVLERGTTTS